MTVDVKHLRELLEARDTPGPLRYDEGYDQVFGPDEVDCPRGYSPLSPAIGKNDLRLHAAAVNALPELLEVFEAAPSKATEVTDPPELTEEKLARMLPVGFRQLVKALVAEIAKTDTYDGPQALERKLISFAGDIAQLVRTRRDSK